MKKLEIPKEIFESIFFQNGGQKKEDYTGQYEFENKNGDKVNAEIENGEFIFDEKGIRKAIGKTHEKGGIQTELSDGAKILSDHLKIGAEYAKKLKNILGTDIKATDTFAKVLDKFGKTSGLYAINEKLEDLVSVMEKQEEKVKDENTSNLNLGFLTKQVKKETENKAPIEKEREGLFEVLFNLQEASKKEQQQYTEEKPKMQMGGTIRDMALKYNISEERATELLKLPKYQFGAQKPKQEFNFGSLDFKYQPQTTNVTQDNAYLQAENAKYTNAPSKLEKLPYNPITKDSNAIYQGDSYKSTWEPLVKKSMEDPKRAQEIDNWLTNNKGPYAANILKQLEGLTGDARNKKITELATDSKPGPFHNAIQQAIEETKPIEEVKAEVKAEAPVNEIEKISKSGEQKVVQGMLSMPNRPVNMPTWNPSLKVATRLNRIDPALISPEQQIAETDRAVMGAQQDLNNLSPAQRAVANIGITANQVSSNGKAIQESNRFNAQAENSANSYNAKIGDIEQQAENQNALSYEERTFRGLGAYENDMQNMQNQQFRDQTEKFRTVNMYNAQNALNKDVQFDGEGFKVYRPDIKERYEPVLKTIKKKYGGRFKK